MTRTPPDQPALGPVIVNVFGKTDVGRTREHNEDAFMVADLTTSNATLQPEVRTHVVGPRGSLFMVADGMGGAAAGELASAMAVETLLGELKQRWVDTDKTDPEAFASALRAATDTANKRIHAYAADHPENRGMGTTATIAGLLGDTLYLCQVGDSRAYIVRGNTIKQITKDQSLMQRLIEANELTEEEAEQSERRNIILQALGPEPKIKIDLTHQQIRRGDVLLLCSDGLSGQVKRDEMLSIVREEKDLVDVCKRLIDRANENGGPDNITVIAARFDGDGLQPANESDALGHAAFAIPEDTPTAQFPAYVKRHSGTPPMGAPAYEPPKPTREVAPLTRPSHDAAADRRLVLLVGALVVLVLAVLAFRFMASSGDAGPEPRPDTAATSDSLVVDTASPIDSSAPTGSSPTP